MRTIIYRPSVEKKDSYETMQLQSAFQDMELIDKTVCDDRIVYIFKNKNEPKTS